MKKPDILGVTVAVTGLRDLMRALRHMDKAARTEIRDKLRSVGQIVADEAKSIAKEKMAMRTGALLRSIRVRVLQRGVFVVAAAKRRSKSWPAGYNYPKRLEYAQNKRFAFLRPALEAKQEEAIEKMNEVLDEIEREWMR